MRYTEKKMGKIIGELMHFFFSIGAGDYTVHVTRLKEGFFAEINTDFNLAERQKVERLDEFLRMEKSPGLEEAFWQLAGVGNIGGDSEISLIAQMIDRSELEINKNHVRLIIYKNKD